jgi:hypothetical protein
MNYTQSNELDAGAKGPLSGAALVFAEVRPSACLGNRYSLPTKKPARGAGSLKTQLVAGSKRLIPRQ